MKTVKTITKNKYKNKNNNKIVIVKNYNRIQNTTRKIVLEKHCVLNNNALNSRS
jgi:hypothetical protein